MKKVVIFSSKGGGGHIAVTNALQEYLHDDYLIEVNNIFTQALGPLDLLHRTTKGRLSAENFYNMCIARKWYNFLNGYYKIGSWFYHILRSKAERLIHQFLDDQQPDLIVSVVPLINNIILQVAKQRNIPFLLIPTDLDISSFITKIDQPTFEKFKIALAFEDNIIQKKISAAHISDQSCVTTGFLLRPDFFEKKECYPIKYGYKIPEKKPTILVLLGAVGSLAIYDFVQQLMQVAYPCHILICIGNQLQLKSKIEKLAFPNHITYTIIEFTDRISDLMAISDLLITKSGSVSVNEAIYMNLPMILDATCKVLKWEQYNHVFIVQNNFGQLVKHYSELPSIVTELLLNRRTLDVYKNNLIQFNKKNGGQQIKKTVKDLLNI